MNYYLFFFVSMTFAYMTISQDVVSPKVEEAPHPKPAIFGGIPVDISGRCPETMDLYPGPDDKSPGTCKCRFGLRYFPLNNTCFEVYRQGPCEKGSYVYWPKGEDVPICIENPCLEDGRVPFNGTCYTIKSSKEEPCGPGTSIRVHEETFHLECAEPQIHITGIITVPKISMNPCPPNGHKIKGVCRYPL